VTVEEHYVIGGLGTIVQESVCDGGLHAKVRKLGLPHTYATSGPYRELMAHYGLDAKGIAESAASFVSAAASA
jgi:transketolase